MWTFKSNVFFFMFTQLYGIQYSYLVWINSTQLYGFMYFLQI